MGRELRIGLAIGFGLVASWVGIVKALGPYRIEGIEKGKNLVQKVTAATVATPLAVELPFRGVVIPACWKVCSAALDGLWPPSHLK